MSRRFIEPDPVVDPLILLAADTNVPDDHNERRKQRNARAALEEIWPASGREMLVAAARGEGIDAVKAISVANTPPWPGCRSMRRNSIPKYIRECREDFLWAFRQFEDRDVLGVVRPLQLSGVALQIVDALAGRLRPVEVANAA